MSLLPEELAGMAERSQNFRTARDAAREQGTGYPCHLAALSASDVPELLAEIAHLQEQEAVALRKAATAQQERDEAKSTLDGTPPSDVDTQP